jgi:hypothetical protein
MEVTGTCDVGLANFQIVYLSDQQPGVGLKQSTTGGFGHAKPWVEMRVRIDNDRPREVASEDDYLNYAHLVFVGAQTFNQTDPVSLLFRAKSAGTIEKAIRARSILVELTTGNGVQKILEIKPQEPSFQKFASRCDHQFWHLASASGEPTPDVPRGGITSANATKTRAVDGFVFVNESRVYKGTFDGFAAALPGFVQRAAATSGLPPRDHEKEIAYVTKVARACFDAAPELAAFSSSGFNPKYGSLRVRLGCTNHDVSERVLTGDNPRPSLRYWSLYHADARPFFVTVEALSKIPGRRGDWRDGIKIHLFFKPLAGDLAQYLAGHSELTPDATKFLPEGSYTIIDATITATPGEPSLGGANGQPPVMQTGGKSQADSAPRQAEDGFKFLSVIPMAERQYDGIVEGFVAKLSDFVRRAATASGLPLHDYGREVDFIAEAVRTCAQAPRWSPAQGITFVMAVSITFQGRESLTLRRSARCTFSMKPNGTSDGRGLAVGLYFRQLSGDPPPQI